MGKPPPRVRYNAKARGSVAGGSLKHGKLRKSITSHAIAQLSEATTADSNMEMIVPPPRGDDDEHLKLRRGELRAEVILLLFMLRHIFNAA